MKSTVQKWGNSLAIRIPLAVAQQCHLKQGVPIDISVEDKKIIIKLVKKKMNLSKLLADINETNLHAKVDIADFIGKEDSDD